jgi:hypothetical protein
MNSSRLAIWQSAGGSHWATTVIKTLAPFSNVTPPKTPPHKSLSQRTSAELKGKSIFSSRSLAPLSLPLFCEQGKQKQKPQKNKKLTAN